MSSLKSFRKKRELSKKDLIRRKDEVNDKLHIIVTFSYQD